MGNTPPPYRVILASASPRRRELLSRIFDGFDIIPSQIDETVEERWAPAEVAKATAVKKGAAVARLYPDALVISSDTIVYIDGEILGKPEDESDAKRMLKRLSGNEHTVYTGVYISCPSFVRSFVEETRVRFRALADDEIDTYVAGGEPMDKAGSYGIQGDAADFVESFDGDRDNVMGLPVARLKKELSAHLIIL